MTRQPKPYNPDAYSVSFQTTPYGTTQRQSAGTIGEAREIAKLLRAAGAHQVRKWRVKAPGYFEEAH